MNIVDKLMISLCHIYTATVKLKMAIVHLKEVDEKLGKTFYRNLFYSSLSLSQFFSVKSCYMSLTHYSHKTRQVLLIHFKENELKRSTEDFSNFRYIMNIFICLISERRNIFLFETMFENRMMKTRMQSVNS